MGTHQRGLRAELAFILNIDPYTYDDLDPDFPAPHESTSNHLARLIRDATKRPDEVKVIYSFLPAILLRFFGYAPGRGWLETCADLPSRDRNAIMNIVLPKGPLHRFCKRHSTSRESSINISSDMRFEFSRNNLPQFTKNALNNADTSTSVEFSRSYLAPLLINSIQKDNDDLLYLTPIDYFYICIVASPAIKWSSNNHFASTKRSRRSSSLPSMRALYNQLLYAYASILSPEARADKSPIFLATCLDYLFIPWAFAKTETTSQSTFPSTVSHLPPITSAAVADAIASILLALVPPRPTCLDLDLDFDHTLTQSPSLVELGMLSNSAIVYRLLGSMLYNAILRYDVHNSPSTMCAYLRVLAIYLAPWRVDVRKSLKQLLLPREKTPSQTRMAKLQSTISFTYEKLASPTNSPQNGSEVKECEWRDRLVTRQVFIDRELVRLAIVRGAQLRMGSTEEGGNHLALLADAATAAKISEVTEPGFDYDQIEELRRCLEAVRDQKTQFDMTATRKSRNYIGPLAACVGEKIDNGVLQNISERIGIGNITKASEHRSRNGNGRPSNTYRTPRQQRTMSMKASVKEDIPFLGNVWERPVSHSEIELLVVAAYRLALMMEPYLGFIPNFRFFGQVWFWVLFAMFYFTVMTARGILVMANHGHDRSFAFLYQVWLGAILVVVPLGIFITRWIVNSVRDI